jgi:hypothetical protein
MGGMVAHAKRAADHLRHPLARPDLAAEAVRLGPRFQQRRELRRELRHLLGAQPWLPTGRGMAAQPLHALLASALEPLAHGSRRHAEGRGDVLLFPALLFQLPGASPPSFAPVELRRLRAHTTSVAPL